MRPSKMTTAVLLGGMLMSTAVQAQDKLKVFILAGQSNMQGHGWFNDRTPTNGIDENGTLQKLIDNDPLGTYDYLQSSPGVYNTRSDVNIFTVDGNRSGALTVGYGVESTKFGIELGFGWQVGDQFTEDVLLIKTSWGGKSLQTDFRPPSAVQKRGGSVGFYYNQILAEVDNVLQNVGTYAPGYTIDDVELQGFAWHQGWNDRVNQSAVNEYAENIADFINDIRFDLRAADLPFVIANTGIGGPGETNTRALDLMAAQVSVDELTGTNPITNVRAIDTRQYWRDASISPITGGNQGFHWNQNGETMFLMGDEMGSVMTTMSDYVQFERAFLTVNRQTGEVKLVNPGTNPADFEFESYTINSDRGALDVTEWTSIAGNYDSAGDASVDPGFWSIFNAASNILTENDAGGDDASLAPGQEISLGNIWVDALVEDLTATFTETDGTIRTLFIQYEGTENITGDLNTDGVIDAADWAIFIANAQTDISGLSAPLAYRAGDLDADGDSDINDFRLFKLAYEAQNPALSFEQMVTGVPEPGSFVLLAGGVAALCSRRRTRN